MLKMANGYNRRAADTLLSTIQFNAYQADSLLVIDKGIQINKTDKFRNQRVIITIYVPLGKQIKVAENTGWGNHIEIEGPWDNDWDLEMDEVEHGWDRNVDYIMKEDGLHRVDDDQPAEERKRNNKVQVDANGIDIKDGKTRVRINENGILIDESDEENYRYENQRHQKALDSIKTKLNTDQQRLKDSLQKVKDKAEEELRKLNTKKTGGAALETETDNGQYVLPVYNPMMLLMGN